MTFDYYYGIEAEQFSFYRVPRLLIKDECFKSLSSDAKLLYGLMLDRMALSMKNGWLDEENKVYIIYSVEEVMGDLCCAREKCSKIIAELDSKKGIGLIERKRRGLGKPDIIYVKNFSTLGTNERPENKPESPVDTDVSTEIRKSNLQKFENRTSRDSKIELAEIRKSNLQKFGNRTCRNSEIELQEIRKSNSNYTNINYNNNSYINNNYNNNSYTDENYSTVPINLSNPIIQSDKPKDRIDKIDENEQLDGYIQLIKENIDYDYHIENDQYGDKELYDELFQVICEIVCVPHRTIRIGGEEYPYELVKARFLKLNSGHLEYVMDCMKNITTKIGNIKAYMITALYNATITMNHYYQQEVQHDMYG